ncbi:MAG: hypothetical protein ACREN7_03605 [Candidatus Dormibacteria bacterium]
MNHLLLGFALCGALVIYPGGLAVLAALVAAAVGRRRPLGQLASWASEPARSLQGVAAATVALVPLPFPGNPVAPVGISWAGGSELGNLGLSLAGLFALAWLAAPVRHRGLGLTLLAAWSLGLGILALSLGTGSWEGVLGAGGPGAEAGRVLLGSLALGLPLLWFGGAGGEETVRSCGWVAAAAMGLLLLLPQLRQLLFPGVLLSWWVLGLVLAAVGGSGGSVVWRRRSPDGSGTAAKLNVP